MDGLLVTLAHGDTAMFSIHAIYTYALQILIIIFAWMLFYVAWTHPEIQLLAPLLLHGLAPLRKASKQMGRSRGSAVVALEV